MAGAALAAGRWAWQRSAEYLPAFDGAARMVTFPDPDELALMVSEVTQTMLGLTFSVASDVAGDAAGDSCWRNAVLPLVDDAEGVDVALSSDTNGCRALAAGMFGCEVHEIDDEMMEDALAEVLNITAGVLKRSLSLDQRIGLVSVTRGNAPDAHLTAWRVVPMRNEPRNECVLLLSISPHCNNAGDA